MPTGGASLALGWAGTSLAVAGTVVAGIGTYLWVSGRGPHGDGLAIVPQLDAQRAGILAVGRF